MMKEKNFYSLAFIIWPIVGACIGTVVTCVIGTIANMLLDIKLFFIYMFFIYGSILFYGKYLWVGVPLALLSRFLPSDGRLLLIFFVPVIAGLAISWQVSGVLMGEIFYIVFGVGWINVFVFLWALAFLKKKGLVIPDNEKQIS